MTGKVLQSSGCQSDSHELPVAGSKMIGSAKLADAAHDFDFPSSTAACGDPYVNDYFTIPYADYQYRKAYRHGLC